MFFIFCIIIPLFIQNQVFSSPVLLWSNTDLPESSVPLSTVSPLNVLTNYICKLTNKEVQIRLFAVNDLTNEDIQQSLKRKHPLLLNAKDENSPYRYIPDVGDDVYRTFSLIPQSNNLQCAHIHFQIASANIYETLNEALNAMETSINNVEKASNDVTVMALINGPVVSQSLSRPRRQAEVFEDDIIVSNDSSCMFYAERMYLSANPTLNYTLDLDNSTCTPNKTSDAGQNSTASTLRLTWKAANGSAIESVSMTLVAQIIDRYWYLTSVFINQQQYRYFAYGMHSEMDTPPTYSYVCTTSTFVAYNTPTKPGQYDFQDKFYITNLQFQPFHGNGSYFGPPNYCTSFFTSGIWMGITSSLLCLGILLFGVSRLMSIKSNDRFDDPKGKPLIIKAQE